MVNNNNNNNETATVIRPLVTALSTTDRADLVSTAADELLSLSFRRRPNVELASEIRKVGGVVALIAAARNFPNDERISGQIGLLLLFLLYEWNDTERKNRAALIRCDGIAEMFNMIRRDDVGRNATVLYCALGCIGDHQPDLGGGAINPSAAGGASHVTTALAACNGFERIVDDMVKHVRCQEAIGVTSLMLACMVDNAEYNSLLARALMTGNRLDMFLCVMRECRTNHRNAFCMMRILCCVARSPRNAYACRAMNQLLSRSENFNVTHEVIEAGRLHPNDVRVQTQATVIIEVMTERHQAEYGHAVDAGRAAEFVIRAMEALPDEVLLYRSAFRVLTNLIRRDYEQGNEKGGGSAAGVLDVIGGLENFQTLIDGARRRFKSDSVLRLRYRYLQLLLAKASKRRLRFLARCARSPFLCVPFVLEDELDSRRI